MVKVVYLSLMLCTVASSLFGQKSDGIPASVDEVIEWNFRVEFSANDEAMIIITVNQKDHWHIYAQQQPKGGVSLPTTFTWPSSDQYELLGDTKEFGAKEFVNEGFPEKSFTGEKALFKQKIKIKTREAFTIRLGYEFMACKVACFPPTFREVDIKIKPKQHNNTGSLIHSTIQNLMCFPTSLLYNDISHYFSTKEIKPICRYESNLQTTII